MTINKVRENVEAMPARSAWSRGVKLYAYELIDSLEESIDGGYFSEDDLCAPKMLDRALLNGAADWAQYSWGGCSLVYDEDIALRLCTPSELKKTKNGQRNPNATEQWLDTQGRALYQAARLIKTACKEV